MSTETGPAPTTPNAVPTGQCAFMYPTAVQCASSDPAIALDFDNAVSTVGCTFSVEISWGDGSSVQTVNIAGGPAGPEFVANHTYEQNGTFLISAEATTMSGACFTGPGTYSFTLSR